VRRTCFWRRYVERAIVDAGAAAAFCRRRRTAGAGCHIVPLCDGVAMIPALSPVSAAASLPASRRAPGLPSTAWPPRRRPLPHGTATEMISFGFFDR